MKVYSYYFFFFILISTSCHQKMNTIDKFEDCFPDRKNIKTHQMREGTIKEVMTDFFAITVGDSERFSPCNLTSEWKVEGKKVKFQGIEKEIFPNERRAATPFLLQKIEAVE